MMEERRWKIEEAGEVLMMEDLRWKIEEADESIDDGRFKMED
jgi:hypothetical protein